MKVNVNVHPPVNPEFDIDLNLDSDTAYWLLGILSATTDETGRKVYNAVGEAIAEVTGVIKDRIIRLNPTAAHAREMARGYRFESEPADNTVQFLYDGHMRTVKDPVFERDLLKGFELKRGDARTDQYKSYRLERIGSQRNSLWRGR